MGKSGSFEKFRLQCVKKGVLDSETFEGAMESRRKLKNILLPRLWLLFYGLNWNEKEADGMKAGKKGINDAKEIIADADTEEYIADTLEHGTEKQKRMLGQMVEMVGEKNGECFFRRKESLFDAADELDIRLFGKVLEIIPSRMDENPKNITVRRILNEGWGIVEREDRLELLGITEKLYTEGRWFLHGYDMESIRYKLRYPDAYRVSAEFRKFEAEWVMLEWEHFGVMGENAIHDLTETILPILKKLNAAVSSWQKEKLFFGDSGNELSDFERVFPETGAAIGG